LDPNTRLRIATRIRFALLRHLGEGIDVGTMLRDDAQAREVLWVCQASGDTELARLACEYERTRSGPAAPAPARNTDWGTGSDFAPIEPPSPGPATVAPTVAPRWRSPSQWLRRGSR
jgi:hypothetical protein